VLSFSQNLNSYHNLIKLADDLAYNFQFDSANVIINKAIKLDSKRPEAFQLLSKIYLWYSLGNKDENNLESFFAYSDSTIVKSDLLLDELGDDKNIIYILGNIYKYRAMVYGTNGNTLDAFWSTKKAVSFYEDVIAADSNYFSAYGGIGIFEYALSYVPALFDWALTISGLSADKQNGYDLIEKAYKKGVQDKKEYQFHLAKLLDEHYAEYQSAIKLIKDLVNKHPQNSLFHYQLAIEYMKLKDLRSAEEELNLVLEINHPKFTQTNSFSYFLKGDIYFRNNKWDQALDYYLKFLQSTETIDYAGIASLRSAYCYFFFGNENEFKKYLLLASNGNHDIEDDSYANKISDIILEDGMNGECKLLIEIENSFLREDVEQTLELTTKIDSLTNADLKAEAYVYLTTSLINLNKLDEAKLAAENSKKIIVENSFWTKPMSLYNLAFINFKQKNYEVSKELLLAAEDINDFRKKHLIQSYINNLKKKMTIK